MERVQRMQWNLPDYYAGNFFINTYSRVQKSIENWSVWSKMALGEVGVSLP